MCGSSARTTRRSKPFADRPRLRYFFGNLYHLNAEEELKIKISKGSRFKEHFGPRGVLHSDGKDDTTEEAVRLATVSKTPTAHEEENGNGREEFVDAALDFTERQTETASFFFVWLNTTACMSLPTPKIPRGVTYLGDPDEGSSSMVMPLASAKLDDSGIADNTIVIFTTDNGAENCLPDRANPAVKRLPLGRRIPCADGHRPASSNPAR